MGGTKVCSNDLGHMIMMAIMPIYGKKTFKNFFSLCVTNKLMTLKLGIHHLGLRPYKVCANDVPGLG